MTSKYHCFINTKYEFCDSLGSFDDYKDCESEWRTSNLFAFVVNDDGDLVLAFAKPGKEWVTAEEYNQNDYPSSYNEFGNSISQ